MSSVGISCVLFIYLFLERGILVTSGPLRLSDNPKPNNNIGTAIIGADGSVSISFGVTGHPPPDDFTLYSRIKVQQQQQQQQQQSSGAVGGRVATGVNCSYIPIDNSHGTVHVKFVLWKNYSTENLFDVEVSNSVSKLIVRFRAVIKNEPPRLSNPSGTKFDTTISDDGKASISFGVEGYPSPDNFTLSKLVNNGKEASSSYYTQVDGQAANMTYEAHNATHGTVHLQIAMSGNYSAVNVFNLTVGNNIGEMTISFTASVRKSPPQLVDPPKNDWFETSMQDNGTSSTSFAIMGNPPPSKFALTKILNTGFSLSHVLIDGHDLSVDYRAGNVTHGTIHMDFLTPKINEAVSRFNLRVTNTEGGLVIPFKAVVKKGPPKLSEPSKTQFHTAAQSNGSLLTTFGVRSYPAPSQYALSMVVKDGPPSRRAQVVDPSEFKVRQEPINFTHGTVHLDCVLSKNFTTGNLLMLTMNNAMGQLSVRIKIVGKEDEERDAWDKTMSIIIIVCAVAGGLLFILAVVALGVYLHKARRGSQTKESPSEGPEQDNS